MRHGTVLVALLLLAGCGTPANREPQAPATTEIEQVRIDMVVQESPNQRVSVKNGESTTLPNRPIGITVNLAVPADWSNATVQVDPAGWLIDRVESALQGTTYRFTLNPASAGIAMITVSGTKTLGGSPLPGSIAFSIRTIPTEDPPNLGKANLVDLIRRADRVGLYVYEYPNSRKELDTLERKVLAEALSTALEHQSTGNSEAVTKPDQHYSVELIVDRMVYEMTWDNTQWFWITWVEAATDGSERKFVHFLQRDEQFYRTVQRLLIMK